MTGVRLLTDEDAHTIRDLYADGITQAAIALEYNVAASTISNVVRGKTYPTAGGPLADPEPRGRVLNAKEAKQIREEHVDGGATIAELSAKYGTGPKNISHILVGRNWPNAGGPISRRVAEKAS